MTPRTPAYINHRCAGRARFKFAARRGDTAYFFELAEALASGPGVLAVHASPLTASVLVRHEGPLEDIVAFAQSKGLFALVDHPVTPLPQFEEDAGALDVNTLLALLFFGLGIVQVVRGHVLGPAISLFGLALQVAGTPQAQPRRRRSDREPAS